MNKNRVLYIDLLKIFSILMMVFIHVLEVIYAFDFYSKSLNITKLFNWSALFNIFTPTIFMLCMGCGLYLSKNKTPHKLAKRGLRLLYLGLILNFVRGFIFFLILGFVKDKAYISEAWYWLWGSDIMYFAGLYFLLYALMKKLNLKDIYILLISIIMFIISCFILNINIENYTLNMIIGNFIYLNSDSYFPLLTWSIIPIIGYYYQKYFDIAKNKNRYVLIISLFSLIIFIVSLTIFNKINIFKIRYLLWSINDQIIDAPTLILTLSINFVYIGLIYFLSKLIKSNKISTLVNNISCKINTIYCIHWIMIMYIVLICYLFFQVKINNIYQICIITLIIYILSIIIANILKKNN